jgi:hypothetical protein
LLKGLHRIIRGKPWILQGKRANDQAGWRCLSAVSGALPQGGIPMRFSVCKNALPVCGTKSPLAPQSKVASTYAKFRRVSSGTISATAARAFSSNAASSLLATGCGITENG